MYPQAKLVGPKGLVNRRKDLKFDIVLPEDALDAELDKEFKAIPMTGHPNEVCTFLPYIFHTDKSSSNALCRTSCGTTNAQRPSSKQT
jgi:hypothetical protein